MKKLLFIITANVFFALSNVNAQKVQEYQLYSPLSSLDVASFMDAYEYSSDIDALKGRNIEHLLNQADSIFLGIDTLEGGLFCQYKAEIYSNKNELFYIETMPVFTYAKISSFSIESIFYRDENGIAHQVYRIPTNVQIFKDFEQVFNRVHMNTKNR